MTTLCPFVPSADRAQVPLTNPGSCFTSGTTVLCSIAFASSPRAGSISTVTTIACMGFLLAQPGIVAAAVSRRHSTL